MPYDWGEYLQLAQFLQGQPAGSYTIEAAQRSAVSRAYYAAFCSARNFARRHHGFKPTYTGEDHPKLREHFVDQRNVEVADNLDDLRKWRNKCDYDDAVDGRWLPVMLASAITSAQEVIKLLK